MKRHGIFPLSITILLTVIFLNIPQHAHGKEFSLYGITLDSSVEDIIHIAKENNYPITGTGMLGEQYSLRKDIHHPNALENLNDILFLDPNYDAALINKATQANRVFTQDTFDSFMNDIYYGCLNITLEKDIAKGDIVIKCYFVKIDNNIKILAIQLGTGHMDFIKTVFDVFTDRYGNPYIVNFNLPDSGIPYDSSKPLRYFTDYIWEIGEEVSMISIRCTNTTGAINIYNKSRIHEVVTLLDTRADQILQQQQNAIESENRIKENQRKSKI